MSLSNQERYAATLKQIPYAAILGVEPLFMGKDFTLVLPFKKSNIGNPALPALHGGAIGGFMEMAAVAQILLDHPEEALPKTIGINIDYLRRGKPQDCFAKAKITRHGQRIINVNVSVWQDNPETPIAVLHGHFLVQKK
jgi:uncharacterized protein (TIGR00369 family)